MPIYLEYDDYIWPTFPFWKWLMIILSSTAAFLNRKRPLRPFSAFFGLQMHVQKVLFSGFFEGGASGKKGLFLILAFRNAILFHLVGWYKKHKYSLQDSHDILLLLKRTNWFFVASYVVTDKNKLTERMWTMIYHIERG